MWYIGQVAWCGGGGEEPGDWAHTWLLPGAFGGGAGIGAPVVELPAPIQAPPGCFG